MRSVEIKLSTLTPIYTGGIDGKSEQLHSQGVLGSLRWWEEEPGLLIWEEPELFQNPQTLSRLLREVARLLPPARP